MMVIVVGVNILDRLQSYLVNALSGGHGFSRAEKGSALRGFNP